MDSPEHDDYVPTFYIGQHESKRSRPVTDDVVRRAHECNYDMLTAPITTSSFHERVLALFDNLDPDSAPTVSALTMDDTDLMPDEMTSHLLAMVSPWIDLCSPDPVIYNISRQVLHLEIAYAAFCGVTNVILPRPKLHHGDLDGEGVVQYAYSVQEILNIGMFVQVHIRLHMIDDPEAVDENMGDDLASRARLKYVDLSPSDAKPKVDVFGTWDAWNIIRSTCNYNPRLFVALDLCQPLLTSSNQSALEVHQALLPSRSQSRWHCEPLRVLIYSITAFVPNQTGYPVLSRVHRDLLTKYMRLRNPPWILLSDVGPIPGIERLEPFAPMADGDLPPVITADVFPLPSEAAKQPQKHKSSKNQHPTPHLDYLRQLQKRQPPRTVLERYGAGFQDYLQTPLQPLTDNLESITYEVFEKCPVKYEWYERAIARALRDWEEEGKAASGPNGRVVIAVVGAGRGPLVTRALRASETEGVDIELWALEKNPNACVILERHNQTQWQNRVNIVRSDMRSWQGPFREAIRTGPDNEELMPGPPTSQLPGMITPIDILVSELLGSFADNELSPECLDGMLPKLNPSYGLSIPCNYTAFLTPISAPKLHADISSRAPKDPAAPDTPWVVMLQAIDYLSTTTNPQPQPPSRSTAEDPKPNILPVWSFIHEPAPSPAPSTNSHNTRQARLPFRIRDRGVCHGLAGYFEATLYPGVELSTNPLTMGDKSADMMSWFPIFFPLKVNFPPSPSPFPPLTAFPFPSPALKPGAESANERNWKRDKKTPLYLPDNSEVTATIRRCTDERKVWYEWVVESWGWNLLIGGGKKRVRLGVSEVGCSKGVGCMM